MICLACGGHLSFSKRRGTCDRCGTIVIPERANFSYDEDYLVDRNHDSSVIKACKTASYERQLTNAGIELRPRVLEFGFGGGAFLEFALNRGSEVYGIEAHAKALERVARLGERLHVGLKLAEFRDVLFDSVFYFDSFEHIVEPREHLQELARVTRSGTEALLVLPSADSLSRQMMGRLWPHDIPDHWVFYSEAGLIKLWDDFGWRFVRRFSPPKQITTEMVLRHLGVATPIFLAKLPPFWLNFGEMGLVFEKA